jgi:hypothetical protein
MHTDRYGLPLTTASDGAAAAYREGVDRLLSAWPGADEAFDRAVAEDPRFALAHSARARVHQVFGQGQQARAEAALARQLANGTTDRERRHVEIVAAAIEGRGAAALGGAEQHLDDFPRDAVVFSLLLGSTASMRSRAAPTTTPRASRSASAMPGITARIGGSSPISAGRIPKPAMPASAAR